MSEKKLKPTKKKVIPIVKQNVLQKAELIKSSLTIGGVYLPEKDLKENTLVKSYKIKEKMYTDFFAICYNSGYSLNLIVNQLIAVFVSENKSKIKPTKKQN